METLCTVLAFIEMVHDFSLASKNFAKFSLYSEISHLAKIAKFSLSLRKFLLLQIALIFNPSFKISPKTAKINEMKN